MQVFDCFWLLSISSLCSFLVTRNAFYCSCRTKNYQKKITHIGSIAFQKVCALKIQCLYRGYTVRKYFKARLRQYYRELTKAAKAGGGGGGAGSVDVAQQQRRKQYYESEFSSITNKLNANLDSRSSQVNTMLRYFLLNFHQLCSNYFRYS